MIIRRFFLFALRSILLLNFVSLLNPTGVIASPGNDRILFLENFDDGDFNYNPTWSLKGRASVVNGQLVMIGKDFEYDGRFRTELSTEVHSIPSVGFSLSFRGKLDTGGRQNGREVRVDLHPYQLRITKGRVSGFPTNMNAIHLALSEGVTERDLIVTNFSPERDKFYNVEIKLGSGNILYLYVDGDLIGTTKNPSRVNKIDAIYIRSTGSATIDDIVVKEIKATLDSSTQPATKSEREYGVEFEIGNLDNIRIDLVQYSDYSQRTHTYTTRTHNGWAELKLPYPKREALVIITDPEGRYETEIISLANIEHVKRKKNAKGTYTYGVVFNSLERHSERHSNKEEKLRYESIDDALKTSQELKTIWKHLNKVYKVARMAGKGINALPKGPLINIPGIWEMGWAIEDGEIVLQLSGNLVDKIVDYTNKLICTQGLEMTCYHMTSGERRSLSY